MSVVSQSHVPDISSEVWIAGAGVSGRGSAELASRLGWKICIVDDNSNAASELASDCGGRWMAVADAVDAIGSAELIVTSPGWRPDSLLLSAAREAGVDVIGDVELAWRADQDGCFGTPRTWLVVTGTNGKTTTTSMLAAMMQEAGRAAEAVGNIGTAVGTALTQTPRIDVMVAELSSFQLHWAPTLTPDAGALLNLAEDHLDWHGSMANYAADKARALRGPIAVIGADDPLVVAEVERLQRTSEIHQVVGFTLGEPKVGQLGVRDGRLIDRAFEVSGSTVRVKTADAGSNGGVDLADATTISPAGPAGVADALAAAALARSQGVPADAIRRALQKFQVRAHRGQVVHEANGVKWIDNSKATNPHAAAAALAGLDSVIWVAGGQLKGAQIDQLLTEHGHRIKAAIVIGVDRRIIVDALKARCPEAVVITVATSDPHAAMMEVGRIAAGLARPGDTVLLAPAAASLDMYTGMAQRGDLFAEAAERFAVEKEA